MFLHVTNIKSLGNLMAVALIFSDNNPMICRNITPLLKHLQCWYFYMVLAIKRRAPLIPVQVGASTLYKSSERNPPPIASWSISTRKCLKWAVKLPNENFCLVSPVCENTLWQHQLSAAHRSSGKCFHSPFIFRGISSLQYSRHHLISYRWMSAW